MKVTETLLKGCFIIEHRVFKDARGLFYESFNKEKLEAATNLSLDFVQDNESISSQGVLRGLHYQTGEFAQAKLIRVSKGEALDVVVDLRNNSETFGQHFKINLSESKHSSIFIPKGMAHGFLALSKEVIFSYKCDTYYNKESERGIIYDDPSLNIDWEYPKEKILLSAKDEQLPTLKEVFS